MLNPVCDELHGLLGPRESHGLIEPHELHGGPRGLAGRKGFNEKRARLTLLDSLHQNWKSNAQFPG